MYGSDRVLLELARALKNSGASVTVAIPGPAGRRFADALDRIGVRQWNVPDHVLRRSNVGPIAGLRWLLRLLLVHLIALYRRSIQLASYDIVISNTAAVLIGPTLSRILSARHVWYFHEIVQAPPLFVRLFKSYVNMTGAFLVANSSATAAQFGRPVVVVPNPISSELWRALPTHLNLSRLLHRESLRVGCIGRYRSSKGQWVLLEAWETFLDELVSHELHFFGSRVPGAEEFEKDVADDIAEIRSQGATIVVHDFCSNQEKMYSAVDIVVVPSTVAEGFGLVAAEASAAGKPIVASAVGGLNEVVKHNRTGLLVPPGNPEVLAQALVLLTKNRQNAARMAHNGWTARDQFSPVAYRERIAQIVLDVLDVEETDRGAMPS